MTTAKYACVNCKDLFTARIADRKRGWARYCSKSCKAKKQEARTGQYKALLQGGSGSSWDQAMADNEAGWDGHKNAF